MTTYEHVVVEWPTPYVAEVKMNRSENESFNLKMETHAKELLHSKKKGEPLMYVPYILRSFYVFQAREAECHEHAALARTGACLWRALATPPKVPSHSVDWCRPRLLRR